MDNSLAVMLYSIHSCSYYKFGVTPCPFSSPAAAARSPASITGSEQRVHAALTAAGRGKAVGKKPTTEYIFAIDGDKTQLQQLLSKTSPVMQSMGLTPKEQALRQLNLLLEVINKKIPLTSSKTVIAGAQLVNPNCKAVNAYLTTQYLSKALPCK